jgi:hypothetical protein
MMRRCKYLPVPEKSTYERDRQEKLDGQYMISGNSQESHVTRNDMLVVICAIFVIFVTYRFLRCSQKNICTPSNAEMHNVVNRIAVERLLLNFFTTVRRYSIT